VSVVYSRGWPDVDFRWVSRSKRDLENYAYDSVSGFHLFQPIIVRRHFR
jgi:hypothetical protein